MENTIHVKLKEETVKQLRKLSVKEARTMGQIARLAIEEIADRGYTDKVIVKGKI